MCFIKRIMRFLRVFNRFVSYIPHERPCRFDSIRLRFVSVPFRFLFYLISFSTIEKNLERDDPSKARKSNQKVKIADSVIHSTTLKSHHWQIYTDNKSCQKTTQLATKGLVTIKYIYMKAPSQREEIIKLWLHLTKKSKVGQRSRSSCMGVRVLPQAIHMSNMKSPKSKGRNYNVMALFTKKNQKQFKGQGHQIWV